MCKFCDANEGWVKLIESAFKLPDGQELTVRLRHDVPNTELDIQAVIYASPSTSSDWSEWSNTCKLNVCPICNRILENEETPARTVAIGMGSTKDASGVILGIADTEDTDPYLGRGYAYVRLAMLQHPGSYHIGDMIVLEEVNNSAKIR
jgi:hypothetical protein